MTHPALSAEEQAELTRLEEAMWTSATRFDPVFQQARFAADFLEFGRSGRVYQRADILSATATPIDAVLPLPKLQMRRLDVDTVQLTYDSQRVHDGAVEHAHRSSIWSRTPSGWVMRFHQGTPFQPA